MRGIRLNSQGLKNEMGAAAAVGSQAHHRKSVDRDQLAIRVDHVRFIPLQMDDFNNYVQKNVCKDLAN